MPRASTRCPQCREPVSPFAAGCAICGADLEAARAQVAARRRPALPRVAALNKVGTPVRVRVDWVHVAVALILALAAPPVGFLLSLYWALQRHRAGEPVMVVVMLGAAALAAAAFFAPAWFWSRLVGV